MVYGSLIFFIISAAIGFAGTGESGTHFDSVSHLLASAFFVISVLFFALRHWGSDQKDNVLKEYEKYI